MFTKIALENFKAFGLQAEARLSPLTLVYGANSSGKSSLINTLLILKQTISPTNTSRSPLAFTGSVDFGNFRNLVFKHQLDAPIRLGIGIDFKQITRPVYGHNQTFRKGFVRLTYTSDSDGRVRMPSFDISLVHPETIDFTLRSIDQPYSFPPLGPSAGYRQVYSTYKLADFSADSPIVARLYDQFTQNDLNRILTSLVTGREVNTRRIAGMMQPTSPDAAEVRERAEAAIDRRVARYENYTRELYREDLTDFGRTFTLALDGIAPYQAIQEQQTPPPAFRLEQSLGIFTPNILDPVLAAHNVLQQLVAQLDLLTHIGPIREEPKRTYIYRGDAPLTVGSRGEDFPDAMFSSQAYEDELNRLCEIMEIGFSVQVNKSKIPDELNEAFNITLLDKISDTKVSLNDVGFGVSQVLPVLLQLIMTRDAAVVIEQPELHLNPRLQATLGQVFSEAITERPSRQIIVETHSEHLLLRLQRCIRNGTLDPTLLSVLYVSHEAGGSFVQRLELADSGDLVNGWPDGFFDDAVRELFPTER